MNTIDDLLATATADNLIAAVQAVNVSYGPTILADAIVQAITVGVDDIDDHIRVMEELARRMPVEVAAGYEAKRRIDNRTRSGERATVRCVACDSEFVAVVDDDVCDGCTRDILDHLRRS